MADAKTMNVKILHVTKTTAQWAAETTVISKGLLCIETTTDGKTLAKVGDGASQFSALPYLSDGSIDITEYYTSEETDTAIGNAIAALGNVITVKGVKATVGELPTEDNNVGDLWFVGDAGGTTDSFAEYIWTTAGAWEFLGRVQTEVDLSDYATITYVDGKVTTINGRLDALEADTHTHANADVLNATTASYTTEEKTKLAGIAEGANKTVVDTALSADSTNPVENKAVQAALDTKVDKVEGKALSANDFTDELKAKLEGIDEGATSITVDAALSADSTNPVENKAVKAALDTKVDAVEGKGLSTNDYTTEEKTKLAGIAEGANKTVVDTALDAASTNPVENKAVKAALDTKVDAVEGKGLSTNDYTTEEKTKLAGLENYDDTDLTERVEAIEEDYIKSTDTLVLNCTL